MYQVRLNRSGAPTGPPSRISTGLDAHTISLSADGSRLAYSEYMSTDNLWSVEIPTAPPVSVAEARPVTTGNQTIEMINVSTDETQLIFDADWSGNQDLYVMPIGGGEPRPLTVDPGDDFNADFSPDASEVAFHSIRGGTRGVYIVSTDGRGTVSTVTDDPSQERSPRWSPNGTQLAYASDRSGRYALYVVSRSQVDAQWGQSRRLVEQTQPPGGLGGSWSPDGRAIAYLSGTGLWKIPAEGGESELLFRNPNPNIAMGRPTWSKDGRAVYVMAADSAGERGIWSIPVGGGTPSLLVRFDDPSRQPGRGSIGATSDRFFFIISARESDVWVAELTSR